MPQCRRDAPAPRGGCPRARCRGGLGLRPSFALVKSMQRRFKFCICATISALVRWRATAGGVPSARSALGDNFACALFQPLIFNSCFPLPVRHRRRRCRSALARGEHLHAVLARSSALQWLSQAEGSWRAAMVASHAQPGRWGLTKNTAFLKRPL
jgi:hypothetical protein